MLISADPPDVPGDAEGAALGDAGSVLEGGGQIASRGVGDIPLPAGAASVVDSVGSWPPADWGPKFYEIDAQTGSRIGPHPRPGE